MEREFLHYYPHADLTKFDISDKYGVSFNYKGMGYDVFKNTPSGPQEKYLDLEVEQAMLKALGPRILEPKKVVIKKPIVPKMITNFPPEFLLAPVTYYYHEDFSTPIQRTEFTNLRIYVDASKSFNITPRNIFTITDIKHYKDAYRWIKGPDLSFWPQMLNFVTWCATGGCGVAEDMLSRKDNIGGLLRFHVAFTVRRLLFEMTCLLPNDETFDPRNLKYDKAAAETIQNEFKAAGRDFRYTHGSNNGLGDIYATDGKKVHISWGSMKPDPEIEARNNKFPGGSYDFDKPYQRIGFIYNPLSKDAWKYFIPSKGRGLTVAGLARINRSIEAFVFCILGAQTATLSSIVGISGSAEETRQQFLVNFESAITQNDIKTSIERYEEVVKKARARLDFAITPGTWLFPSNLIRNTESIPGYNNKLQRATKDMKFGVNNINQEQFSSIPHFVEKSPTLRASASVGGKDEERGEKHLPYPARVERSEEYSDHTLQKIGLSTAAIALGYYIIR